MKRFKDLLSYLEAANLVPSEKLNGFVTDANLQLSGKKLADGQIVLAYKHYTAVFEIDNYQGEADQLLAYVACWVANNAQGDDDEELEPPSFDVEPVSDRLVDVMIEVPFCERLVVVRDDNGPYEYNGQRYSFGQTEIDIAETVEVDGEAAHG